MKSNAIVRCDGSYEIGSGHIYRTLVLANELRNSGFEVTYLCRDYKGAQYSRIKEDGFRYLLIDPTITENNDTLLTIERAIKQNTKWLIVDRYAAREKDFRKFKESGLMVMAIDDICNRAFPVDILLNQNINAMDLPYETLSETLQLLGTDYTLIRNVYLTHRPLRSKIIKRVKDIMIFMGGADHLNATEKILLAVNRIKRPLNITIVLGKSYQNEKELEKEIKKSLHKIGIYKDLSDLSLLMKNTDLAISACGGVIWEFCCMGVPTLMLPIAKNQEAVASKLDELGCALSLGNFKTNSVEDLTGKIEYYIDETDILMNTAHNALKLVDGLGVKRVVEKINA